MTTKREPLTTAYIVRMVTLMVPALNLSAEAIEAVVTATLQQLSADYPEKEVLAFLRREYDLGKSDCGL